MSAELPFESNTHAEFRQYAAMASLLAVYAKAHSSQNPEFFSSLQKGVDRLYDRLREQNSPPDLAAKNTLYLLKYYLATLEAL